MYSYGIGALQPQQDAFKLENEAHQAKLSSSVSPSAVGAAGSYVESRH